MKVKRSAPPAETPAEIKVSVIVPVYNTAAFLDACLRSILRQTLRDIEVICVDDGSMDKSLALLKKYARQDGRVIILTQKNKGAGAARNAGIRRARGRYLSFLDSDDYFDARMLEAMYEKAVRTDADIVHCMAQSLDNKTGVVAPIEWNLSLKLLPDREVFSHRDLGQNIFRFSSGTIWDKLIKFQFVKDKKLWFQEIQNCNDTAFSLLSLALADKIAVVPLSFVTYRQNNDGSLTAGRDVHWDCFYAALTQIREILQREGLYGVLRPAYEHVAVAISLWALDYRREPVRSIGYDRFLNGMLAELTDGGLPLPLRERIRHKRRLCHSKALGDFFSRAPDKIVPVVFSAQNADVPYLGVAIQSVLESGSPDYFYDIYVLHRTIGAPNVRRLEGLTRDNGRVCCIDVSAFASPDAAGPHLWGILPRVLFQYPKVVCLSPFVFVRTGLEKLLRQNMSGRMLAGVPVCATIEEEKRLASETGAAPDAFIDPAVLLVDLRKLAAVQDIPSALTAHRINALFGHRIKKLDDRWNTSVKVFVQAMLEKIPERTLARFGSYADAFVFSFDTPEWMQHQHIVATLWWASARQSPFHEELICRGAAR